MWRHVECPYCGSRKYKCIFIDSLTWKGEHYKFKIVKCTDCKLIYTNPLSEIGIGRIYYYVDPKKAIKEEYLDD